MPEGRVRRRRGSSIRRSTGPGGRLPEGDGHQARGSLRDARALAEDVERWMADEPVSAWREPCHAAGAAVGCGGNRTAVTAAAVALWPAWSAWRRSLGVQAKANGRLQSRFRLRPSQVGLGRLAKAGCRRATTWRSRRSRRFTPGQRGLPAQGGPVQGAARPALEVGGATSTASSAALLRQRDRSRVAAGAGCVRSSSWPS